MENTLINRVAESGILTINLENYFPANEIVAFDIKDYLFHGLILKEKEFRAVLKEHNWDQYKDKVVLIYCSSDAIIPLWAFMLVSSQLGDIPSDIFCGTEDEYLKAHYQKVLENIELKEFKDQRVVIKGCSHKPVPAYAYAKITALLRPFAQSIMFGEPCSTVPVFKRPRVIPAEI
ncbi:MAG: DUF2480 family protein [Saprospiraceae bacterium]|nr:DUF2480 family protein [Saprospiraceae bacterium]